MKHAILTLFLFAAMTAPVTRAVDAEILPDDLMRLQTENGFKQFSLAQIYLALPQDLFEGSFQQRIKDLAEGRPQFNDARKEIYYPGDGGQAQLRIQVHTQTEKSLILHIIEESDGEKILWRLERIPHGWRRLE